MKILKDHLNVIIAEIIFPQELSKWYNMSSFGKKTLYNWQVGAPTQ